MTLFEIAWEILSFLAQWLGDLIRGDDDDFGPPRPAPAPA